MVSNNRRLLVRALEFAAQNQQPAPLQSGLPAKIIGLNPARAEFYGRIDARIDQQFDAIIAETKKLNANGVPWARLYDLGLEYRWAARVLEEKLDKKVAAEKLKFAIHAFARRQLTWFRKMKGVTWVESSKNILSA